MAFNPVQDRQDRLNFYRNMSRPRIDPMYHGPLAYKDYKKEIIDAEKRYRKRLRDFSKSFLVFRDELKERELTKEYNTKAFAKIKKDAEERLLNQKANATRLSHKRRAAKLDATPSWYGELDDFVFVQAYELCRLREHSTDFKWHVDHMVPLQAKNVCGLHVWNNFQCLPQYLNSQKRNKTLFIQPNEWLAYTCSQIRKLKQQSAA